MEASDDRLSTRDIASPGAESMSERDTALADPADAPRADTAPVPAERTDRAEDAERPEPVGDGDVVTEEPAAEHDRAGNARGAGEPGRAGADAAAAADTGEADRTDDAATDDRSGGATAASKSDGDGAAAAAQDGDAADGTPLLQGADEFQSRWEEIQVRFVDEPRGAVEDADALVATVMQHLAEGFAQERDRLEAQWGRGEDISTEDLRVALQRYRSFFRRLLST